MQHGTHYCLFGIVGWSVALVVAPAQAAPYLLIALGILGFLAAVPALRRRRPSPAMQPTARLRAVGHGRPVNAETTLIIEDFRPGLPVGCNWDAQTGGASASEAPPQTKASIEAGLARSPRQARLRRAAQATRPDELDPSFNILPGLVA